MRALHERGFEPQRDDHTDRGHMRRGREVHIQRVQLPAVVGDVGAAGLEQGDALGRLRQEIDRPRKVDQWHRVRDYTSELTSEFR